MNRFVRIVATVICMLCVGVGCGTQKATIKTAPPMAAQEADNFAQSGDPGPEHQRLQPLVGRWSAKSKFWYGDKEKPELSTATVERKWILGRRFIQENYEDHSEKIPFTGLGLLGYDKSAQRYISTWADTMSTSLSVSTGTADAKGKLIRFTSEQKDPETGEEKNYRSELVIINKDKNVLKMFEVGVGGKETEVLEIEYTRMPS